MNTTKSAPAFAFVLMFCVSAHALELDQQGDRGVNEGSAPIKLTTEQKQEVAKAVKASLKYPETARFPRTYAVRDASATDGYRICGTLEASDGYGRYAPPKRFAFSDGRALVLSEKHNQGFVKSGPASMREITVTPPPRAVAGSWWVSCRIQNQDGTRVQMATTKN